jgi:hypothetical protein
MVTMDVDQLAELWIARDYLPELLGEHAKRFPSIAWLAELLPGADVQVLPVHHDCQDQFMAALWARPEAYLDPVVRAATSPWYDLSGELVEHRLAQLRGDLESGVWQRHYGDLVARRDLDVGLRLITGTKRQA